MSGYNPTRSLSEIADDCKHAVLVRDIQKLINFLKNK